MMNLTDKKQQFLVDYQVGCPDDAARNALWASFQRGKVYSHDFAGNRWGFQEAFREAIAKDSALYAVGVDEEDHLARIMQIADDLSSSYGHVLRNERLRIGTVQKGLNLNLKIMWCIEPSFPTPAHCPVDRIVLQSGGILGNWTEMNSIETYKSWISRLRDHVALRHSSLSEWELDVWASYRAGI